MNEYRYKNFDIGTEAKFTVEITEDMVNSFFTCSGDHNPLHINRDYAVNMGFNDKVVYGMLTASLYSTLSGVYLPGKYCILKEVNTSFHNPVYIGDHLTVKGKVTEKHDSFKSAVIIAKTLNQNGKKVSRARITVGFYNE